ncbi:MAG: hypothetical protein HKN67_03725 [Saprospiraceae bacterium]|nr:hypothetical protein [Saprospiraceae bacterium]
MATRFKRKNYHLQPMFWKRLSLFFFLMITGLYSCDYHFIDPHRHHISFIDPDKSISDSSFSPCFEEKIFPFYYGSEPSGFRPGKDSLAQYFHQNFDNFGDTSESGFITIRYVINCQGEAGRFILHQLGPDYKKKEFNQKITNRLLELVKNLKDWRPIRFYDDHYDSFIYLSFKIENGELTAILP